MKSTTISIAEGKKGFSRFIEDAHRDKEEIIVTKRGKPVAVTGRSWKQDRSSPRLVYQPQLSIKSRGNNWKKNLEPGNYRRKCCTEMVPSR